MASHSPPLQVHRLEPLIDWEREARVELTALRTELQGKRGALALAVSERNGLLRENDKIIAHYRWGPGSAPWRTKDGARGAHPPQQAAQVCLGVFFPSRM